MFGFRGMNQNWERLESEARQMLLGRMVAAYERGDRREVDRTLVEAKRWLTTHPDDAVILEARERLRASFVPLH